MPFSTVKGASAVSTGMKGAAITDCSVMANYMDYRMGVLAGQDLWDGYSSGIMMFRSRKKAKGTSE